MRDYCVRQDRLPNLVDATSPVESESQDSDAQKKWHRCDVRTADAENCRDLQSHENLRSGVKACMPASELSVITTLKKDSKCYDPSLLGA